MHNENHEGIQTMQVQKLFEDELASRGVAWSIDAASGRHCIDLNEGRLLVSLANLERDVASSADVGKIARFVDSILESDLAVDTLSAQQLYWILEPNDYVDKASFRVAVSKRADRVLIHLSSDEKLVSWVTPDMLQQLGLSDSQAEAVAFSNLERALSEAALEISDVDGVGLGFISTSLPFKAALLLAPNLKKVMEVRLGWPLLAVAPDRDFVYLWAARHTEFAGRLGEVVVREHAAAPYPISTEIFELSDQGVRAIGAFSSPA